MQKNINWQPADLENNLVKLVPLKEDDFDRLFAIASDPKIWEQYPVHDRYLPDVFRETFFESAAESKTAFIIIDQVTNKVIGSTRYYDYTPEEPGISIGWTFIARTNWGGKYNRAIKTLMLDYAFQFVNTVYLHIGINNLRSQMATSKLGAKKVREFIAETNGRKSPSVEYAIDKNEWIKQKA